MASIVLSNTPAATKPDENGVVYLVPRPLAREVASFVLLPLLPMKPPLRPLPAELWVHVFRHRFEAGVDAQWKELVTVSRAFKNILGPLIYDTIAVPTLKALEAFTTLVHASDQRWDSIRRIPYSTPGRWVKTLDLTRSPYEGASTEHGIVHANPDWIHAIDAQLLQLVPLLPFLEHLALNPEYGSPSRRVLSTLATRDGAERLRSLTGVVLSDPAENATPATADMDTTVQMLSQLPFLEELGVVGAGLDVSEGDLFAHPQDNANPVMSLDLPNLRKFSALSLPSGPLMHTLIHSPLPELCSLTITPYDNIPSALTSAFLAQHGSSLHSLSLVSPAPSWPTVLHPSPSNILHLCPMLTSLSLCHPVPTLLPPPASSPHPLCTLSLPRPCSAVLSLVSDAKRLPSLCTVRIRDVRWLRAGVASGARLAGVQGDMREWRARLTRRGVILLDSDGCEATTVPAPTGQGLRRS